MVNSDLLYLSEKAQDLREHIARVARQLPQDNDEVRWCAVALVDCDRIAALLFMAATGGAA